MALPCTNLNLNLYRVFYTVAKTKSFSESSRTLHISQPAISKHIQNLEYELNTILFYRTNRGIELTPEAKALLVYVEKAYNYIMLGERELQENQEQNKGKITIGCPTYISIYYLNDYMKGFITNHHDVIIKMMNYNNTSLQEWLTKHSTDILFLPGNFPESKEYKAIPIAKDEFCFAYNSKFDLKEVKTLEELLKYPLLLPVSKSPQRQDLEKQLSDKNLTSNPVMELEDSQIILDYIKEGFGIGYLEKKIISVNPELEIVPLEEPLPEENISLIYKESALTSTAREFINGISNIQK